MRYKNWVSFLGGRPVFVIRVLTLIPLTQSSSRFQQIFITVMPRPSSITSEIVLVTQECPWFTNITC